MAVKHAVAVRNGLADLTVDRIDVGGPGTIQIRSGTRPANPDAAATGTLLGTVTFAATAFGTAANGTATAAAIASDTNAAATGTATWFRVMSGGGLPIFDGDIATSGADMNLSSTSIVAGGTINITSGTYTASP
jgi:hypothetical protein